MNTLILSLGLFAQLVGGAIIAPSPHQLAIDNDPATVSSRIAETNSLPAVQLQAATSLPQGGSVSLQVAPNMVNGLAGTDLNQTVTSVSLTLR